MEKDLTGCQNLPSYFINKKVASREGVCLLKMTRPSVKNTARAALCSQRPIPGARFWSLGNSSVPLSAGASSWSGCSSSPTSSRQPLRLLVSLPLVDLAGQVLTSNIPSRLREPGSLAQGHTPNRRQLRGHMSSDFTPISTSPDPLSKPQFLLLGKFENIPKLGTPASVPHGPGRRGQ